MALSYAHKTTERKTAPEGGIEPSLSRTIERGVDWLLSRFRTDETHPGGYWVGAMETNATMEAEWILALHVIGAADLEVDLEDGGRERLTCRLARAILDEQRPDGAWEVYKGAPAGDVNGTVECYAALRAAGYAPDHPALEKARAWIHGRGEGGLPKIRVFTRYWLALIGEWPWSQTPYVPPEAIFLPSWFPINIYSLACWARATAMPIAVLCAHRFVRPLECGPLDELFPEGRSAFDFRLPAKGTRFWSRFFRFTDRLMHATHALTRVPPVLGLRRLAVNETMSWIIKHQDADGVWGGIQPPWIYGVMALHAEGYGRDHPVMAKALGALNDVRWRRDAGAASYVQACTSPVWDTLLTLMAAEDARALDRRPDRIEDAVEWLLAKQVLSDGDWSIKAKKGTRPGGWAFEYENRWYPDVDDTAVALIVLASARDWLPHRRARIDAAIERALEWIEGMQCRNGGWGAFDRDNHNMLVTKVPFCDFGEAIDPPTVDVTAHVVEAYGRLGRSADHPPVARALAYLKSEQEEDGSWFGRWGVNYIYGTAAVLPALKAIGEDMNADYVSRAADFILSRQQASGAWGESCASYMEPDADKRAEDAPTPSQTGWALMGLAAANRPQDRIAMARGAAWLAGAQKEDGRWDEDRHTGAGFPGYGVGDRITRDRMMRKVRDGQGPELSRGFMLNYNLYRQYFPIIALSRVRRVFEAANA